MPQENVKACIVCTVELSLETLDCGHSFCPICLENWKKQKDTYPVCRVNMKSKRLEIKKDRFEVLYRPLPSLLQREFAILHRQNGFIYHFGKGLFFEKIGKSNW